MKQMKIETREYFKLKASKEMLDRVMDYLEKNHFSLYKFIMDKEIAIVMKEVNQLQEEVYGKSNK